MTPDEFRHRLSRGPLVIDGGLATQLESAGHDIGGSLWSARVLRDDPAAVRDAHIAFLAAGAELIITASYQVSRRGLIEVGSSAREADQLLVRSVQLANEAREQALADGVSQPGALVAASVGPWGATNHDGSEYRGRYGVPRRELVAFHRERLEPLVAAAPDLLAVETIPDLDEVEALIEALSDYPDLAAWISLTTPDGRTVSAGQPLGDVAHVVASCPSVVAVGVNCSAADHVLAAVEALAPAGLPLLAYPNAGQVWDAENEQWHGPAAPVLPAALPPRWLAAGVRVVGGCCGVGPEGISELATMTAGWHSD